MGSKHRAVKVRTGPQGLVQLTGQIGPRSSSLLAEGRGKIATVPARSSTLEGYAGRNPDTELAFL